MLAALTPSDTETLGLLALIKLQASRLRARTRPGGESVLLLDQDRARWDRLGGGKPDTRRAKAADIVRPS